MKDNAKISTSRAEFIEKIGLITQCEGMPRIAGRLFGLMVFDGRPFSFGELAEELQVSRGSISSSVRMLEDKGVIKRVAKSGDRQDYFQLGDAPYSTMLLGIAKRASTAKTDIEATLNQLPTEAADVATRLNEYANFYRAIEENVSLVIAGLQNQYNKDESAETIR